MQASVPQLMDVSDEPQHVLDLYGTKEATARSAPTACSRDAWPNAESASSSCTIATGTITAR